MWTHIVIVLSLAGGVGAHADTISPGEMIQFSFTLSGVPTCSDGPCDTLLMTPFGGSSIFVGSPILNVQLFNGSTLLGSFTGVPVVASFVSASSLYTFDNPTVIDFSSILDGSIQGIVDYQLTGASITNTSLDPATAGSHLVTQSHPTASPRPHPSR